MIKKLSIILIMLSFLIALLFFLYTYISNKKIEKNINEYIEQTSVIQNEEQNEIVEVQDDDKEETKKKTLNYKAIIEIPSINLKQGIVDVTKNFNSLYYAVSADSSSNYPDEVGNFILYAHSGNCNYCYFKKLKNVEEGDTVYIYYNGVKYHYEIYDIYNIDKTGKAGVIRTDTEHYVTLITCLQGTNDKQVVYIGKLVDSTNY